MIRHKYKFTDKHNTKGGIAALFIGIVSAGMLIWALYMAYKDRGNAGVMMGIIGTGSFGLATVGLLLGLSSFKEEDKFYGFSWIGTILCGVIWVMLCAIIAIGI